MKNLGIVVSGGNNADVSKLSMFFEQGGIDDSYEPLLDDDHRRTIEIDGQIVSIDLFDINHHEEYASIRNRGLEMCDGLILVYPSVVFTCITL